MGYNIFDLATMQKNQKPRIEAKGKLVKMDTNSELCRKFGSYDPEKGIFAILNLSVVTGFDGEKDVWLNVTINKVDMENMPELARAYELLRQKKKPLINFKYYVTETPAVDKTTGQPLFDEIEEKRGTKTVFVQKQRTWKNYRMGALDAITSFKILKDDMPEMVAQAPKKDAQIVAPAAAKKTAARPTQPKTEEEDDGLNDFTPEEIVE